ncbi:MAG: 2-C-methyl-D-erythritol 4-phosphate cytidylyltransferase [Tenericutes bacterium]|jgi:2-C-methyl-D-erythritol 4-phosphate cytidylyltransferase|nr:2-C-methyl-D-erythritol 4-phosphate cytidylyltransferase [Mycoplasmatota bacterium]
MFSAIILGGGSGERMGLGYNKVLYKIKGKTVIEHASKCFIDDPDFSEVIIVANREDYDRIKVLFDQEKVKVIKGGKTRQESVYEGLKQILNSTFVLIHDGARPNISKESIEKLKNVVENEPAILFTKATDSIIEYEGNKIKKYLNRDKVGYIKTPQAFNVKEILKAYELAIKQNHQYNDDASLYMGELKLNIKLIEDDDSNIKLTTKFDLNIMEDIL